MDRVQADYTGAWDCHERPCGGDSAFNKLADTRVQNCTLEPEP